MQEGRWQAAAHFESEALPEPDGALIRADDKIKLHREKTALSRMVQGMGAHCAGHTASGSAGGDHVSAVGNVRSTALLIGAQEVGSEHCALLLGYEGFVARRKPVGKSFVPLHIPGQSIGLARSNDGLKDSPNRIGVCRLCGTDIHDFHPLSA